MNELTDAFLTEYSCESFMVDRTGLDSTTLHLAVRWAMVSVHRPEILLAYLANWPQNIPEDDFQGTINAKVALS